MKRFLGALRPGHSSNSDGPEPESSSQGLSNTLSTTPTNVIAPPPSQQRPGINVEPPTPISPVTSAAYRSTTPLQPSTTNPTPLSRPSSRPGQQPVPQYRVIRKPVASRNTASVRIRRTPSSQSITQAQNNLVPLSQLPPANAPHPPLFGLPPHHEYDANALGRAMSPSDFEGNRRRSTSAPQPPHLSLAGSSVGVAPGQGSPLAKSSTVQHMPRLAEETSLPHIEEPTLLVDAQGNQAVAVPTPGEQSRPGMFARAGTAAMNMLPGVNRDRRGSVGGQSQTSVVDYGVSEHLANYDDDLVDLLDVVDPEIATLSTLTNVQNSLFIPNLGPLLNRRATYNLSRPKGLPAVTPVGDTGRPPSVAEVVMDRIEEQSSTQRPQLSHSDTLNSVMTQSRYAVLPHGVRLEDWTQSEKEELNDHVRHLLHSRREAFKRGMRGFGQYVKRPLGFFVVVYATLITLFGAAWVFFLIGWISLGERRDYIINVVDNVLVALFAIMGDGLAPFRIVDTYHMSFIAHYHHLTWRLRKEKALPKLEDHNDLPAKRPGSVLDADIEDIAATASKPLKPTGTNAKHTNTADSSSSSTSSRSEGAREREIEIQAAAGAVVAHEGTHDSRGIPLNDIEESEKRRHEFTVLTPQQQKKLQHHQVKFMKSHTFYKPHETSTHHAFPLRLLVAIVVLLDCHSCLQISLGACTWAISYHVRPFALTTVILCCSITVNIVAGILIMVGDRRTRKKDVIERMFRQELTEQAIKKIEKKKENTVKQGEHLDDAQDEVTKMLNLNGHEQVHHTSSGIGEQFEEKGEVGGSYDAQEKPHHRWKHLGGH